MVGLMHRNLYGTCFTLVSVEDPLIFVVAVAFCARIFTVCLNGQQMSTAKRR